jgi:probable H4MPT-linked C1 transfer pathway protein
MILGLDVGGAHLKAAWLDGNKALVEAVQVPTPLWQGMHHLEEALVGILAGRSPPDRVGVTMTGELVDLFEDRAGGVAGILDALAQAIPAGRIRVYRGLAGFAALAEARSLADEVASANWLATAHVAARRVQECILVDVGSTTTDIVPLSGGLPRHAGHTDAERLERGELVYTGVVRTPVMAVATRVPIGGSWRGTMAEHFATMADAHRLAGDLPDGADQHPTADGRDRSLSASARRLARMVGADLAEGKDEDWFHLARFLVDRQARAIEDGFDQVVSRGVVGQAAPILGAGVGRFMAARLAARRGRPYRDLAEAMELPGDIRDAAGRCAPAVAVALLVAGDGVPE